MCDKYLRTVVLHFGYAEDSQLAPLIMSTHFTGGKKYEDPHEGMQRLALDFYYRYLNSLYYRNWRPKWKTLNPEEIAVPSYEEFVEFCKSLVGSTIDGAWDDGFKFAKNSADPPVESNLAFWEPFWTPFWTSHSISDFKSGNFIWILESGELILTQLILQQLPDAFGNSVPEQLTDSYCKENGLTSLHYTLDDLGKES